VAVAPREACIARRESMRLQLARLVEHEVSRRRECILALGEVWAALVNMTFEFRSFTDGLDLSDTRQHKLRRCSSSLVAVVCPKRTRHRPPVLLWEPLKVVNLVEAARIPCPS